MSILVSAEPRSVLVADILCLRREGTQRLLHEWAEAHGVALRPFDPSELANPEFTPEPSQAWALCILNLGGQSINDRTVSGWIGGLLSHYAGAPLVIISDRSEDEEAVSALRMGAQGFIHTGIAPEIAMNALSFIMGGGTFFPPGALIARTPRPGLSGRLFGRRRGRGKGSTESRGLPGLHCVGWHAGKLRWPGAEMRLRALQRFMQKPRRLSLLR